MAYFTNPWPLVARQFILPQETVADFITVLKLNLILVVAFPLQICLIVGHIVCHIE